MPNMRHLFLVLAFFGLSAFSNFPQWNKVDVEPAYAAMAKACHHDRKFSQTNKSFCMHFFAKKLRSIEEKRAFFEKHYQPQLLTNEALLTAYYLPLIHGSLEKSPLYPYPVWGVPKNFKTPYLTRQDIDKGALIAKGNPILWVKDKVDLFFLHIQGSGHVELPNGTKMTLGYAAKNGQLYTSIGKVMRQNQMFAEGEEITMQSIKKHLRAQPQKIDSILWQNQSYVFFELREAADAIGGQGIPLTTEGSLAVDPKHIPYGTPVLVEFLMPESNEGAEPKTILVIAQDTGSAIKTEKRADWFLGFGAEAGELAGKMKQSANFTVLKRKKEPKND